MVFSKYQKASPIYATLDIAKRTRTPLGKILDDLYTLLDDGRIELVSVPAKVAFFELWQQLDEALLARIADDLENKKRKRQANFEKLVTLVQSGQSPEETLAAHLGIQRARKA